MVGDLAYFGVRNQGIFVVDLSVPWEPRPIGSQLGFDCWRFEVAGDRCYVVDPDQGLAVLDVSDLPRIEASPFIVYLNHGYGLEQRDGLPLVRVGDRDLLLVDPDVTYELAESTTLIAPLGLTLWNLESDGNLLYGTYRDDEEITWGLKILDVSPTAGGTEVGRLHTITTPINLALEGSLIYLALQSEGIAVIDVADPREPILVGGIDLPVNTKAVAVDGGIAYAVTRGYSDTDGRVITLDVRDPSQPKLMHSLQLGHPVASVAIAGPLVVAGSGGSLLHVISGYTLGSTPPVLLASLQLPDGVASDLEVNGPLIYALTGRDIVIVDVSEPTMPQIIGTWTPIDYDIGIREIDLRGDLLYAGTHHHGVAIIDVAKANTPRLVGFAPASELVQGVAVNDRALFVGNYQGGLHEWPLPCGEHLVPVPDQQGESTVAVPPSLKAFVAPGQSTVTIRFTLERAQPVRLSVFDISGRRVADLDDRWGIAGEQYATWSGRDNRGRLAPSGTYLIRMQSGETVTSSKVVLLR